jgi:hypothetical protein
MPLLRGAGRLVLREVATSLRRGAEKVLSLGKLVQDRAGKADVGGMGKIIRCWPLPHDWLATVGAKTWTEIIECVHRFLLRDDLLDSYLSNLLTRVFCGVGFSQSEHLLYLASVELGIHEP